VLFPPVKSIALAARLCWLDQITDRIAAGHQGRHAQDSERYGRIIKNAIESAFEYGGNSAAKEVDVDAPGNRAHLPAPIKATCCAGGLLPTLTVAPCAHA
jgi:hypothetical protein